MAKKDKYVAPEDPWKQLNPSRITGDAYYEKDGTYRKSKNAGRRQRKVKQLDSRGFEIRPCPSGYRPEIWRLADGFARWSLAWKQHPEDRPLVYFKLEARIDTDETLLYFDNWQRLVERMIIKFWNKELNPNDHGNALNLFVSFPVWENLRDGFIEAARMKRLKDSVEARRADGHSEAIDHEGSGSAGH